MTNLVEICVYILHLCLSMRCMSSILLHLKSMFPEFTFVKYFIQKYNYQKCISDDFIVLFTQFKQAAL